MKLKSLLFGSAAVFAVGTGAQAADLPTVEPVEYVRICDAFGTGFYYIPGSETCLKFGGRVRVESHYVDGDGTGQNFNHWTSRARGAVKMDGRTQTDIGLIRAYIEYQFTVGPSSSATTYSGTGTNLNHAYIQIINDWGTYTAGHTTSFFDIWGSNTFGTRVAIDDPTGESTEFAWTFALGNGFSLTLSAEDPATEPRKRFVGGAANAANSATDDGLYGGQTFPDFVGNIRIDQGWGSFQVMGVVHEVVSAVNGVNDRTGWAAGAGILGVGIPGTGISLNAQGVYGEGAIGYVTTCGFRGVTGCTDGDLDGGTDGLSKAWTVRAGLQAAITPAVTASVDGSFTKYDTPNGTNSSNDFEMWGVVGNIVWAPVAGLSMGPEVGFTHVDLQGGAGAGASTANTDTWGVMWRIQRDFGW